MINFTNEQEILLEKITDFMLDYNQKVNLTAIKEPAQVREKHFIDSAFPLDLINVPCGTKIIDVGTGAGFPGVVWKIFRPDLDITLLDSLRKRVDYLKLLREYLSLSFETIHGRSEELSINPTFREKYDVAVSRAVAKLPALCEFCLPFVKVGGLMLAMKGKSHSQDSDDENASTALELLGGETEEIKSYKLPSGDQRTLIVIRKTKSTPVKFPRQRINIGKNPL
ncbi:MAG: 16S rRNA (guanine(527)-N(7))-methyltransferase RsmG [Oscillospiraceae bacterium]|nr:16S rRNA (guanine(527)-N(7))-methyltransferase RsmG [Oscillospiraceae bacterium]